MAPAETVAPYPHCLIGSLPPGGQPALDSECCFNIEFDNFTRAHLQESLGSLLSADVDTGCRGRSAAAQIDTRPHDGLCLSCYGCGGSPSRQYDLWIRRAGFEIEAIKTAVPPKAADIVIGNIGGVKYDAAQNRSF